MYFYLFFFFWRGGGGGGGVNTKHISSRDLKTSELSLVLRIRENSDVFYTFDKLYLVFTSKKKKSPRYNVAVSVRSRSRNIFFHVKVTNVPSQSQSLPFLPKLQLQNV